LLGWFFQAIAEAERSGDPVDYARALGDAKPAVRNDPDNPQWAGPYFWAPFILTGKR
jgi:CHAT domain-containing protein